MTENENSSNTNTNTKWTVFATWLIIITLILAVLCAVMGSPVAGLLVAGICMLVVIFLLIPPVYDTVPTDGTGKWIYSSNGAVRFDPNMAAHGEAVVSNMSPCAAGTVGKSTSKTKSSTPVSKTNKRRRDNH